MDLDQLEELISNTTNDEVVHLNYHILNACLDRDVANTDGDIDPSRCLEILKSISNDETFLDTGRNILRSVILSITERLE